MSSKAESKNDFKEHLREAVGDNWATVLRRARLNVKTMTGDSVPGTPRRATGAATLHDHVEYFIKLQY